MSLVLGGTTVAVLSPTPRDAATPPLPADTHASFPSETPSDVASYADHVALVTAISETDAPPESTPPGRFPPDETAVYRQVTFRVDETLWTRANAPTAPKHFTALWWGWLINGDERMPFIVHGAPTVFIGAQYVMPIAYDGKAFTAIQPFAAFRFVDNTVLPEDQDTPLAQALTRAPRRAITDVFANAVPDPLAVRYRHLLPHARLAAVIAAQHSGTTKRERTYIEVTRPAGSSTFDGGTSLEVDVNERWEPTILLGVQRNVLVRHGFAVYRRHVCGREL